MAYAKELTRNYLEYLGVTNVTKDGRIFKGDKEATQYYDGRYLSVAFYDPAIRLAIPFEKRRSDTGCGQFALGVHRIVYAWYNKIIPTGMVIDHIDNNKTNNNLDNLRMVTPRENIIKERPEANTKLMKCKLNKDRSFYEDKLKEYTELYEKAKLNKDQVAAHKLRTCISQYRARLRYYDLNKENK